MFGVILSISVISTCASFILTTSTPGYNNRISPGSGNFSEEFAAKHFPKLAKSWRKWSGSLARGHQAAALVCEVEGSLLPVGNMGKCLGVWRNGNLWCGKNPLQRIKYQERFLSPRRSGILQSDLGPLSNRSVVETYVLPVLMYECESWILSEGHLNCCFNMVIRLPV